MTRANLLLIGCAALAAATVGAPAALAQNFSPFLERSGKGAYDLYRDALLCNAALEQAIEAGTKAEEAGRLEQGLDYTANFALFLLDTGDVVAPGGAILDRDHMPDAQSAARAAWRAALLALERRGETADPEIARCLAVFGRKWE